MNIWVWMSNRIKDSTRARIAFSSCNNSSNEMPSKDVILYIETERIKNDCDERQDLFSSSRYHVVHSFEYAWFELNVTKMTNSVNNRPILHTKTSSNPENNGVEIAIVCGVW